MVGAQPGGGSMQPWKTPTDGHGSSSYLEVFFHTLRWNQAFCSDCTMASPPLLQLAESLAIQSLGDSALETEGAKNISSCVCEDGNSLGLGLNCSYWKDSITDFRELQLLYTKYIVLHSIVKSKKIA